MSVHPRIQKLGQTLVKNGVIDEHQLSSALANSDQWGLRLAKTLVRMRLLRETQAVKAMADATGFQVIDLVANPPEASARPYLDESFCRERGVFPLAVREKAGARTLFLAMADPTDVEAIDLVAARCRGRVKPFVASEQLIEKAIDKYYKGLDVPLEIEEESTISEIDEMKLVDVNGRTMAGIKAPIINLREDAPVELAQDDGMSPAQRMAQRYAGQQGGPKPAPAYPAPPLPPPMPGGTTPAPVRGPDPLADILGMRPAAPGPDIAGIEARLTAIEQNLAALIKAQETSTSLVRALAELLIEKRYVTGEEVRARAGRR